MFVVVRFFCLFVCLLACWVVGWLVGWWVGGWVGGLVGWLVGAAAAFWVTVASCSDPLKLPEICFYSRSWSTCSTTSSSVGTAVTAGVYMSHARRIASCHSAHDAY